MKSCQGYGAAEQIERKTQVSTKREKEKKRFDGKTRRDWGSPAPSAIQPLQLLEHSL